MLAITKFTFADRIVMPALPPKADIAAALGQKRTSRGLLDHLVGGDEQCRWNRKANRLCSLEVDH